MSEHRELDELLKRRQERRQRLARLSFEEKIEIVERLRELRLNRAVMEAARAGEQTGEGVESERTTRP